MGWTIKTGRRRDRLRHRPHLESLDDRCLLSAGLEGHVLHVTGVVRGPHQAGLIGHASPRRIGGARIAHGHHGHPRAGRERPAGFTMSASPTAYDPIIHADQARSSYNVDGTGMTVAVIDTGVDYKNPDLGGGFGPGHKVVAGYDFSTDSPDPIATTSQHGTAVAGLVASSGSQDGGVAPGADIVALKVTDGSNTASLDSIARALQWIMDNHSQYNITVVNLSLSDGKNYTQNWFANDRGAPQQVTDLVGQLRGIDIPVVIATGNNLDPSHPQQGEGFAAVVAGAISVTATDHSGRLLPEAQRLGRSIGGSSATTIAAPGNQLLVASGDGGTATGEGTSFATPLVSGAIVLLQQIYEQRFGTMPSVDQIQGWLQGGADAIHDPVTGIDIGQLDVPRAAALIPTASASPARSRVSTTIQVNTAAAVPTTTNDPVAQTLVVDTKSAPAPAPSIPPAQPAPAPSPAPAPVASGQPQVFSAVSSTAGSPRMVSGLAKLIRSMKVYAATSKG